MARSEMFHLMEASFRGAVSQNGSKTDFQGGQFDETPPKMDPYTSIPRYEMPPLWKSVLRGTVLHNIP